MAEFDNYANSYNESVTESLGKFGKYRNTAFIYKVNLIKHLLGKNEPKTILDFGCGIGSFIPYLHDIYKNTKLYGCDISAKSIEIAKKIHPYCDFKTIENIVDLDIYEKIDLIIINTVLHHIPQGEHESWINKLSNIIKKEGSVIVFEHNILNPVTKNTIKKSKGDDNAVMLNPKYCKRLLLNEFLNIGIKDKEIILKKDKVKLRYTYFFPWKNKFFTCLENWLFWLPIGAQYCVFARK
jgi:ubiquinone/menaquinone biosynthesis C-methylase UbiE